MDANFNPDEWMRLTPQEFIHQLAHDARSVAGLILAWSELIAQDAESSQRLVEDTEYTVGDVMELLNNASQNLVARLNIVDAYIESYQRGEIQHSQ